MTAFPGKLGFVDRDRGRLRVDRPVPLQEFAQVAEIFGPENCGRVGGRFVEDRVEVLYEVRVRINFVSVRRKDADSLVRIVEVADQFFTFRIEQVAAGNW